MRKSLLLFLSLATLNESLKGKNQPKRIWKQHKVNGTNVLRNLFGSKNKDQPGASLDSGFKVQGTARLRNGKVKLDLLVEDVSTAATSPTTVPLATATTATRSTTPTTRATSGSTSSTSATSASTQSGSSTTAGTTVASTTVAVTSGSTTAASTTTSPPTPPPSPTTPVSPVTVTAITTGSTVATTTAAVTRGSSTAGSTSASTPVAPTIARQTSPVVTVAATVPTQPVTQPRLPGKPPCGSPVNVNIKIVANEVLRSHNALRRTHGSPDLQLDDQMICDAQNYAKEIAFKGVLKHQSSEILSRKGLGENIGMSCAPVRDGPLSNGKLIKLVKNVAKRWYDEVCQYNFDDPKAVPKTGHFTEIVWSGSKKLGIGYAVGKNAGYPGYECVYVVGRYKPAGNIIGGKRLKLNVRKGNFNEDYCQRSSGIGGALSNLLRIREVSWDKRHHMGHKAS